MNLRFSIFICFAFFSFTINAAIICPTDKYLTCHDDIHDFSVVGYPTILGGVGQARYSDQRSNSVCNVGHVTRTWYLDANGNQTYDLGEHACLQEIYLSYTPGETVIDWPADKIITCKDALPNDIPSWVSGPCDIVGISKQDQIFETDTKSCYKILRTFTVVNWCIHVPGTTIGIWSHTQVIKIDDKSKPSIINCNPIELGTDGGCDATFTVSNYAIDPSPCGQQKLYWTAEVDLWADGSVEYSYSHSNLDSTFLLPVVKSGQSVSFTLPIRVIRGYHTVTWSVHDQCGNVSTCIQKIRVKDSKKPTPYMNNVLASSFEGKDHPLKVPARIFNLGSFDNCTNARYLKYSFSPNVNDTIRTIDCTNAGFQYYTIYVTDFEGNQDYAEVYMLAFDNGACSGTLRLSGSIQEANGVPLTNASILLTKPDDQNMQMMSMSNGNGLFNWENIGIYKNMEITPSYELKDQDRLDIADLKMLQDYIMGISQPVNFQFIAADMDEDNRIRIKDLEILKQLIITGQAINPTPWRFSCELDTIEKLADLQKIKKSIILDQSNGTLTIKSVYKGDISDANIRKTGSRSSTYLYGQLNENEVTYYTQNSFSAEGLQMALDIPADISSYEISSPYFTINPATTFLDDKGKLRFIITSAFQVEADKPLFTLKAQHGTFEEIPSINDESKILLQDYQTKGLQNRIKVDDNSVIITPNPASGSFSLIGKDVNILDIKDISGKSVTFNLTDQTIEWNVPSGLYFLVYRQGNVIQYKKIVKQ